MDEGLNAYGDDLDSVYENGPPSLDTCTGETVDRVDYTKDKFPDSPWGDIDLETGFDM